MKNEKLKKGNFYFDSILTRAPLPSSRRKLLYVKDDSLSNLKGEWQLVVSIIHRGTLFIFIDLLPYVTKTRLCSVPITSWTFMYLTVRENNMYIFTGVSKREVPFSKKNCSCDQ